MFLDDMGFAIMTMDAHERSEKYEGKKVHFMSFAGILCGYHKAYELENKQWVNVTGIIRVIYYIFQLDNELVIEYNLLLEK